MEGGADPIAQRKAAREVRTFKAVADDFLALHVSTKRKARTAYDYYLRSMTYYMRYTTDGNLRARKIVEDGLARFPDSPLLKNRLAWTYVAESEAAHGPLENCRETIDIAYKLGREAEDANNKIPISDPPESEADGPRLRLARRV